MNQTTAMHDNCRKLVGPRRSWQVAPAVVMMLVLAACAARAPLADMSVRPALRVGIAATYAPLAFKRNGEMTGMAADFAQRLGPALGQPVTVVDTPWDDLIPALREHRIDIIMSGMPATEEREQLVSFVHPYLRIGQMMVLRRADAARLRDEATMNQPSTRVGFVRGTGGEAYVRQHFPLAHLKGFDTADTAVSVLRSGGVDVFIHDSPSIWYLTAPENNPGQGLVGRYEPLTEEYLAWAVRQDDTALAGRLNAVLSQWHTDGTLKDIVGKWIQFVPAADKGTPSQ